MFSRVVVLLVLFTYVVCGFVLQKQGTPLRRSAFLMSSSGNVMPSTTKQIALQSLKSLGLMAGPLAVTVLGLQQQRADAKLDYDQKEYENRPNKQDQAVTYNGVPPDFAAVRADIANMIGERADKGPTLVRLAWHSSGTYDKITKTGGSQKGTIRFKEELAHGANAGLDIAVSWLEPIFKKFNKATDLSYADLYTLAGVVAIEKLGGPKIPWRAGRVDSFEVSDVTPDGRLPDADKGNPMATAEGLRNIFGRMGFNDQEIVALSGAHALGRCHATASGYVGPWTFTPTTFNNQYFVLLKGLQWVPANSKAITKFQYADPSGKLMMLPSDIVLIQDGEFKKYVDIYAKDQKTFFSDFAAAFQKLEELGCENLFTV